MLPNPDILDGSINFESCYIIKRQSVVKGTEMLSIHCNLKCKCSILELYNSLNNQLSLQCFRRRRCYKQIDVLNEDIRTRLWSAEN